MSKKLNIYFIRHAESVGNSEKRLCGGRVNYPLTKKGLEQANLVADKLSHVKLDAIYSSPLKRAVQTANAINEKQNIEITLMPSLAEMDFGAYDGHLHSEVSKLFETEYDIWQTKKYPEGFPEQEDIFKCQERFINAIDEIINESISLDNICVSTHGTILRFYLSYLLNYNLKTEQYKLYSVKNTSITKVVYDKENKSFEIEYIGNAEHLNKTSCLK